MAQYGKVSFDFDHWATLAKKDPDAFEQQRTALIQDCIDKAPEEMRRRLTGLQWQVDSVRERSKNPMSACLQISRMMWNSVLEEDGLMDNLQKITKPGSSPPKPQKPTATLHSLSPSSRKRDD